MTQRDPAADPDVASPATIRQVHDERAVLLEVVRRGDGTASVQRRILELHQQIDVRCGQVDSSRLRTFVSSPLVEQMTPLHG